MRKLTSAQLPILVAIVIYAGIFVSQFGVSLNYLLFVIGLVLGLTFFWWETLFYIQTNSQFSSTKHHLNQLLRTRQLAQIVRFLQTESERVSTVSRSYVFIGIFFLTAFFVITSTGSAIGAGIVLGLGLRYCVDIYSFWNQPDQFDHIYGRYLHIHLKREFLPFLRIVYLVFFALFSLMVLG